MMKKILFLVMAVLTAASMMIAGCGGGDKKAAEPEKVLRVTFVQNSFLDLHLH